MNLDEVGRKISKANEDKMRTAAKSLMDVLALLDTSDTQDDAPAKEAAKIPAGKVPTVADALAGLQKLIDTLSPKAKEDLEGDGDGDNDPQNAILQGRIGAPLLQTSAAESMRENLQKILPKAIEIALRETEIDLWEADYTDAQRVDMVKKGQALPVKNDKGEVVSGSYPIGNADDLDKAKKAFGRNPTDEVKAHINKRAKDLGQPPMGKTKTKEAATPPTDADGDQDCPTCDGTGKVKGNTTTCPDCNGSGNMSEAWSELEGEFVQLVEASVSKDGSFDVKVIAPGWGSSGYYGPKVLERDGPKAFPKGTKMFWDHPTLSEERERPERSVRDLAAEFVETPRYVANHAYGPGLYTRAKAFNQYKETIDELSKHIGVSIRAQGKATPGEAEGRKGKIIEEISRGQSVDFVTVPGAGGEVLSLFESARGGSTITTTSKEDAVELKEAERKLKEAQEEISELRQWKLKDEGTKLVTDLLEKAGDGLKAPSMKRLTESIVSNLPIEDDEIDRDALKKQVREAVKAERAYLQEVIGGTGRVLGMGSSTDDDLFEESFGNDGTLKDEDFEKSMSESFSMLGLSESTAKEAAAGRKGW